MDIPTMYGISSAQYRLLRDAHSFGSITWYQDLGSTERTADLRHLVGQGFLSGLDRMKFTLTERGKTLVMNIGRDEDDALWSAPSDPHKMFRLDPQSWITLTQLSKGPVTAGNPNLHEMVERGYIDFDDAQYTLTDMGRKAWASFVADAGVSYIRQSKPSGNRLRPTKSMKEMIESGFLTYEVAQFLAMAVTGKVNIIVSGGQTTGKTTLIATLCSVVSHDDCPATVIEDEREIDFSRQFVTYALSSAETETTTLPKLRDSSCVSRVIIDEVRGRTGYDLLQAMQTGLEGSMGAIKADNPTESLDKWVGYVTSSGNLPHIEVACDRIARQHPLVVQVARLADRYMVTDIVECTSSHQGRFEVQTLFQLAEGQLRRTGCPVSQELANHLVLAHNSQPYRPRRLKAELK